MEAKSGFKSTCFYSFLISFLIFLLQTFSVSLMFVLTSKQEVAYFLGYLITLLIVIFKFRKKLLEDAKNFKNNVKGNVKKIIIVFVVAILLMYLSNVILYTLFGNIASNEESVRDVLFKSPLLMGLSFGLIGPIIEELCFRYPYRDALLKKEIKFIIYTFIFAFVHIIGDFSVTGLLYIIPYLFLSISIGYGFYKTDNIYTSMITHIFNNAFSIIILLAFGG